MQGEVCTGSITYSARTVGVGAGSHVTAAEQREPHMLPQRSAGKCIRHRSAEWSPVATAGRAIAACNAVRYSEV